MSDRIDTLVAELRTDVPEMTDEAFNAGRRALINAPRAAPRRRWLVAAAAVTLVVVGTLVFQAVDVAGPREAAAESLNAAASKITTADEPPLASGQYRYRGTHMWVTVTHIDIGHDDKLSYTEEVYEESWGPANPRDTWFVRHTTTGNYRWLAGNDEEAKKRGVELPQKKTTEQWLPCNHYPDSETPDPCTRPGDWARPTQEFFDSLPTDPEQLYQRLLADQFGRRKEFDALTVVAEGLNTGLYPANLRANVYRALARIPDLQVTLGRANLDGRLGTAYGLSALGYRLEIIIDPANGEYIGSRMTKEADQTVLAWSAVTTGVVNEPGAKP